MKQESKITSENEHHKSNEVLDWLAMRYNYAEKINKQGDVRVIFLLSKEDFETLKKMSVVFNCLCRFL